MSADSPVVEEVRRVRMKISARFDHDIDKYFAHIMELQAKNKDKLVNQITVIHAPEKKARKVPRAKRTA